MKRIFPLASVFAVFVMTAEFSGAATRPVLLELFTSEGCSSCPPADAILEKLDKSQPVPGAQILVLSEHVDYWNHGSYRDPFSASWVTTRQRTYADHFHLDEVYTPQIVVDGAAQALGNDGAAVVHDIEQALGAEKLEVKLTMLPSGHLQVDVVGKSEGAGVFLAVADAEDSTDVHGGENNGRHLHHVDVVRSLNSVGKLNAAGFSKEVNPAKHPDHARFIVFVQEPKQGRIVGAAMLP